ncbi:MAG TPA: SGNH/GDSL hydrolase family protein [Stellaceae bacterium]|jgi:lysophospholipase L1-like esterase|nr:SGNH/GDSL hydrolase family protein [Stellaceae bacterium]
MQSGRHWVGTWAAGPAPAEGIIGFNNHTLRMHPRISLGGERLRVRVSNAYGTRPLVIGSAYVALRDKGPAIVAGSGRKLTFGGDDNAVIAAGAVTFSDPVELRVAPLADLAVSLHLPGEVLAAWAITGRYARQTNYVSPPGNFAAETVMPVGSLSDQWYFLCGIDVLAGPETGGIVALGDSLTDGNISTIDAYARWPDQLARRLVERGGRPFGVMNNGLGGNRILHDLRGDSGLRRFDRDVLAQPGVTHAIVMLGTNDLRNRWAKPEEEVTGAQMIAGLQQMAVRAHSRGIKLIAGTLTPFGNETFMANAWNPMREQHRMALNTWIRDGGAFDGVADFDAALRDPERPTQMLPIYDCGDGLHPSDLGYCRLGDAVDLSLFE